MISHSQIAGFPAIPGKPVQSPINAVLGLAEVVDVLDELASLFLILTCITVHDTEWQMILLLSHFGQVTTYLRWLERSLTIIHRYR